MTKATDEIILDIHDIIADLKYCDDREMVHVLKEACRRLETLHDATTWAKVIMDNPADADAPRFRAIFDALCDGAEQKRVTILGAQEPFGAKQIKSLIDEMRRKEGKA